jgi:hypothetical protein
MIIRSTREKVYLIQTIATQKCGLTVEDCGSIADVIRFNELLEAKQEWVVEFVEVSPWA